jgi:hypothetical protein
MFSSKMIKMNDLNINFTIFIWKTIKDKIVKTTYLSNVLWKIS